ncbi:MAG: hypothetical protein GXO00_00910, partial [Candidatus Diapherotrites archaeon]|nr:hypothetical protein [Candidatus Diapherotrites archaeon]
MVPAPDFSNISQRLEEILLWLEDRYYSFLDFLLAHGIPVDRIVGPLEERGIRTFVIFYGLLALVFLGLLSFLFNTFVVPKHVYYFTDAYGNPLEGVKATFVVDGEEIVLYSDAEGKIVVEGKDVTLLNATYPGYYFRAVDEGDGEVRVVLEPKRYTTKVRIRDKTGTPIEALLKVYVDGAEVFSERGSDFELCFAEVEAKGCIVVGADSSIEFVASAEGYSERKESYTLKELPSRITLILSSGSSAQEEVTEIRRFATVTFNAVFDGLDTPVDGMIYVSPEGSAGTGTPVRITSGVSKPTKLALGAYKVVSAQVLIDGKYVAVEVQNPSFVVEGDTVIKLVLEPPQELFTARVKVLSEEGEPIEGARVVFTFGDQKIERSSGADGVAEVSVGKQACGTASVSAEGYESNTVEVCTGEEVIVTLKKIVKKGSVKVIVYSPTNDPLPNATVYLIDPYGNDVGISGTTDVKGEVLFKEVPVGTYVAVTEFLSVVAYSEEFNVVENETTEVVIYTAQEEVTLSVLVEKGGKPVLGADVKVYDERGHPLGEGTTDLTGVVQFSVPPLIGVTIEVRYLGTTVFEGPEVIPGGTSSYILTVEVPEKQEPFIELYEVLSEDGKTVKSLERGKNYTAVFRVAFNGSTTFSVLMPGLEVLSTTPVASVGEEGVEVALSGDGYTVRNIFVTFKVPYGLEQDVVIAEAETDEVYREFVLTVGKEMACGELFCYVLEVRGADGVVIPEGEALDVRESYQLIAYFTGVVDEEIQVSLVAEDVQSGDRVALAEMNGTLEGGKVYKLEALASFPYEQGVSFYLVAQAGKVTVAEEYLGSWPVYIPELGPLIVDYTLRDAESNQPLDLYYFDDRPLSLIYNVFDINGEEPLTPVTTVGTCINGYTSTTLFVVNGSSGQVSFNQSCELIEISFEAAGYDGKTITFERL